MISITGSSIGEVHKDMEDLKKTLDYTIQMTESQINQIGKECLDEMREHIKNGKRRVSHGESNLIKNINIEFFENGWGIGDISTLNQYAPYWKFVDSGVSFNGMNRPNWGNLSPLGQFSDAGDLNTKTIIPNGTGRWTFGQLGGNFKFYAKKGIQNPLNYTELTWNWLQNRMDDIALGTDEGIEAEDLGTGNLGAGLARFGMIGGVNPNRDSFRSY